MSALLVDAETLHAALVGTVVFDCRFALSDHALGLRQYREGHIPGAYHLDMERDLSGEKFPASGRHPLPSTAALEACLRRHGVHADTPIVLYDAQRLAGAARAWWVLRHAGVHDVRILDGGLDAWIAAGFPLEQGDAPAPEPGTIALPHSRRHITADRSAVMRASKSGSDPIVDAREPERYAGRQEPIDPVAGRIPGAVNLPWQSVTDERGRARSPEALRKLWNDLDVGDDPIVYCGSGVTASVLLLSRALAGLPGGRLYPGSWSEWCAHADAPIERDGAGSPST